MVSKTNELVLEQLIEKNSPSPAVRISSIVNNDDQQHRELAFGKIFNDVMMNNRRWSVDHCGAFSGVEWNKQIL